MRLAGLAVSMAVDEGHHDRVLSVEELRRSAPTVGGRQSHRRPRREASISRLRVKYRVFGFFFMSFSVGLLCLGSSSGLSFSAARTGVFDPDHYGTMTLVFQIAEVLADQPLGDCGFAPFLCQTGESARQAQGNVLVQFRRLR